MKKHETIDSLLDYHAAKQLSMLDADRLYTDIRRRLDSAGQQSHSTITMRPVLRWAIGLSAAAAMLTAVFMLTRTREKGIELPAGQLAAVQLTEPGSLASVTISNDRDISVTIEPTKPALQIQFEDESHQVAQCSVQVINRNGHAEKEKNSRPTWVIIVPASPDKAENGDARKQADFACLL